MSGVIACVAATLVWRQFRDAKCEISYSERKKFLESLDSRLLELGFEPKTAKEKKLKYKTFVWFSLIDPNLNVRIKKDRNKVVLKGRKQDLEYLLDQMEWA